MSKIKKGFKWFGSLTSLSSRRSPEKSKNKAASQSDGSLCGARQPAAAAGAVLEETQSMDDMQSGLRSPGYARSSDMYTHVGTVPRGEKQKKSLRGQKAAQSPEGGSLNRGEHVRDSPLLGALSSLSLTNPEQALPPPTAPCRVSPLTPAPAGCSADDPVTQREAQHFNMASKQDVYVPMDPISERARSHGDPQAGRQETTEAPQEVEAGGRFKKVTDCSGEYVKFSKEKFWLEPPSEKLRKQLEEELRLSGTNLKSHAWYHGPIPWEVSESLVVNEGDFLFRDSRSSQGGFVLTCRWEQEALHFPIRKTVVQSGETYSRAQYSLEGEAFDSVPALVHFYVGSQAALTLWSRAQINRPVNRTLPLSFLETAFSASFSQRDLKGGERVCPISPSSVQHGSGSDWKHDSRALNPAAHPPHSHNSPSRSLSCSRAPSVTSSPSLPKPSDSSSLLRRRLPVPRSDPPQDSASSDRDGYSELQPQSYVERLQAEEAPPTADSLGSEDGDVNFSPVVETASCFRPGRYHSALMPQENKPLEVGILRRVKELLAEVDARTAARYITRTDCTVARILEVTPEMKRKMGVSSGMELLTLPHGQQLRLDLLERFQTMATMLAVNVLGCTGTTEERAALLNKVIQIAAELKTTTGDMFGFAAVMRALELPQVSRLEQTWTTLRQRHTEGAILYEKTLRPFLKSLNDGRESCPLSSTTFPHVLPLLTLLEKSSAVAEGSEPWETAEAGVEVVMLHLTAARTIAQLSRIYHSNAKSRLKGFQEQAEVREIFLTDFQMRLLWGSRGAEENQVLRYSKFDQVLTALSNRLEPPIRRC
ncbi:SH2 domain-containing protein 3C-like isoform X1 [Poecilia formosa]|uniref:SH2 domain-containing protein 3C-like isoform X1 n=1 Tax=Poecilia formosa TaxID=48698 RepID=UPI000443D679|nr:PREDICTED: SH2 domain-containing protein 3C-like isoform X1 [Poecilia formosa]